MPYVGNGTNWTPSRANIIGLNDRPGVPAPVVIASVSAGGVDVSTVCPRIVSGFVDRPCIWDQRVECRSDRCIYATGFRQRCSEKLY
jgi:hypothetical protein